MTNPAREAYETLAPAYDELTHRNDYEHWLGRVLLPELVARGLEKGRALDAGCGTGRAFPPLLERGWEIVGCDVSPAMLKEAERKFGSGVPLHVADLRELPKLGDFELVLSMNDVVNYLTEDGDLERALTRLAANLAPDGLLLFDANTLSSFQAMYAPEAAAGGTYEMTIDDAGVAAHVHRQRHYTERHLREAIEAAGLEALALLGQEEAPGSIELREPVDQERDQKVVCIARSRRG